MDTLALKRGYLNTDFKLFYIKDKLSDEFQYHFHEFNKIIIFIKGNVVYNIEGKSYKLKPWDVLLVNSHQVHKPIIEPEDTYERIILWINSNFLESHSSDSSNLLSCFQKTEEDKCNLVRIPHEAFKNFEKLILDLKESYYDYHSFGSNILSKSLFLQLIIFINRLTISEKTSDYINDIEYDETIQRILSYINEHLTEDLSIENLSNIFFISKYYLMHKFKKETGYTLHNYILQKRLIKAGDLLVANHSPSFVCSECGFSDYSNFVKAFKKLYGISPKQYYSLNKN